MSTDVVDEKGSASLLRCTHGRSARSSEDLRGDDDADYIDVELDSREELSVAAS